MEATNLFCSICGHIFVYQAGANLVRSLPTGWQLDAVLLSDPAHEFERLETHYHAGKTQRDNIADSRGSGRDGGGDGSAAIDFAEQDVDTTPIREELALYSGQDTFEIVADHERLRDPDDEVPWDPDAYVSVNDHVGRQAWEEGSSTYRIAVHKTCLQVARDYVRAQQEQRRRGGGEAVSRFTPRGNVKSMRTLWKVLRMRWDALDAMLMVTDGTVESPGYEVLKNHEAYDPQVDGEVEVLFQRRSDPSRCADPKTMTEIVTKAARTLKSSGSHDDEIRVFQDKFYRLPAELQHMILGYLASERGGWTTECNRLLKTQTWRSLLVDGRVLPFLGPLDRNVFAQETVGVPPLDCEDIIRELMQPPSKETGYWHALGDRVPDCLRSRRWRWELLDKMYVGDVLPGWHDWMQREAEAPAIPLYWDREGRRVYPIERVTACDETRQEPTAMIQNAG